MDGLSRPSGAGFTVVVKEGPHAGEYRLGGMDLGDYGKVEAELLKDRLSPLEAILPELDKLKNPRDRELLLRIAYKDMRRKKDANKVPVYEVVEWLDSMDGMVFTAHLCFQKFHPDMTREQARGIMDAVGAEEFKRLRDRASGIDASGNSTGPNPTETGRAKANGSPGAASTVTSPSNTGGRPKSSTV